MGHESKVSTEPNTTLNNGENQHPCVYLEEDHLDRISLESTKQARVFHHNSPVRQGELQQLLVLWRRFYTVRHSK